MKILLRTALFLLALLPASALFAQSEAAPAKIDNATLQTEDGTVRTEVGPAAAGATADPVTGEAAPTPLTTIAFEEVTFDFGMIREGETVKHKFKFTNTGTNDLILENVKPSCGCTTLDWPKEPISPGKTGEIDAQFNSTGKSGPQMKHITITLNSAERIERVTFTGEVIPKSGATETQTAAPGH